VFGEWANRNARRRAQTAATQTNTARTTTNARGTYLGHVHLGRRADDVRLVHAAQRHAVDLERARDEQQPAGQLLEHDDALALEAAGEHDDDGARRARLRACGRGEGRWCEQRSSEGREGDVSLRKHDNAKQRQQK
jgi:hypothetical protein